MVNSIRNTIVYKNKQYNDCVSLEQEQLTYLQFPRSRDTFVWKLYIMVAVFWLVVPLFVSTFQP